MRHLDPVCLNRNDTQIKEETLSIDEIKEEIPGLIFSQYEGINNFPSDQESLVGNELDLPLSPESDSAASYESLNKLEVLRRNRRKPLLPQRAIQSEGSQNSSLGNSSECSQDAPENLILNFNETYVQLRDQDEFFDLPESDDLLQDIDEENIFKGLREETGIVKFYWLFEIDNKVPTARLELFNLKAIAIGSV